MAETIKAELKTVKQELRLIEEQLEELLEHQQELLQKKSELEQQLSSAQQDGATAQPSTSQNKALEDWEKKEFPWSSLLDEKRDSVFKMSSYRPLQLLTMNATLSGEDVLLIMPTGGGKSLCFQLPAFVSKGITVVVSPLVSLMNDQVMALEGRGVKVAMLSSGSSKESIKEIMTMMTDAKSQLKMLYVTPERLAQSKRFMSKLEKMHQMKLLSRIVIDEVHCCSQWGHDFRPDYKILGILKRQFPGVPILGLTATATTKVLDDVKKMLQLKPDCLVFRSSFNRPNLFFEVKPKSSSLKESIDEMYALINSRFKGQSGIIYCFSKKDSEEVASELCSRGIRAGCYHAYLDHDYRSKIHTKWIQNQIQVVVATIAFGMGIDKADVRFVIHHSISKSMENYYQESGRAGRDSSPAHCILYYHFSDMFRQSTMVFTEQTGLHNLYGMISYCLDQKRCRRDMIARHFGERWQASQCNKMCDHCARQKQVESEDISQYAKDLVSLLESAASTNQRVTGLKLMEAWLGKGAKSLRNSRVKPPKLSRADCSLVISQLIIMGYLKEDFHFTPYSTISYIIPAGKVCLLQRDGHKVMTELSTPLAHKKTVLKIDPGASHSKSKVDKQRKKQRYSSEEASSDTDTTPSDSSHNASNSLKTKPGKRKNTNSDRKLPSGLKKSSSHSQSDVKSASNQIVDNGSGDHSQKSHDSDDCWEEDFDFGETVTSSRPLKRLCVPGDEKKHGVESIIIDSD